MLESLRVTGQTSRRAEVAWVVPLLRPLGARYSSQPDAGFQLLEFG